MTHPWTRRELLGALSAAGALQGAVPQKIVSVRAAPLPLLPISRFGTKQFQSDHDLARFRWFGPFSQLAGAILVQIRTDQGITGYGMGGGGSAAVHIIENHLKDLLMGANALNIDLLWQQMYSSSTFYGRRGLPVMAISGIDLALWDIAGKSAGLPVWQLLGGKSKEKVSAYFTGNQFQRGFELGFRAFKMGLPDAPLDKDNMLKLIAILRQARSIIGPDSKLMIDCLCRWNVDYTLEFAERAADLNLYFIEEALPPDDVAGYQILMARLKGPKVAHGEHEFTRYGFQEQIRNRTAHILQPDLTWGGGLSEGVKIATMAQAHGIPVMPHRGGSVFGIHLVLAHANCPMAESFGTGEPGNEMMARLTPPFRDGHYWPPESPGIGADLPDDVVRKHCPSLAG